MSNIDPIEALKPGSPADIVCRIIALSETFASMGSGDGEACTLDNRVSDEVCDLAEELAVAEGTTQLDALAFVMFGRGAFERAILLQRTAEDRDAVAYFFGLADRLFWRAIELQRKLTPYVPATLQPSLTVKLN